MHIHIVIKITFYHVPNKKSKKHKKPKAPKINSSYFFITCESRI